MKIEITITINARNIEETASKVERDLDANIRYGFTDMTGFRINELEINIEE